MLVGRYLKGSLFLGLVLSLCGCASPSLVGITISPSALFMGGPGAQGQLTAIGTFDQGNHPKITRDITDQVTWKSNAADVATVSSTGLVTATNIGGSTLVTASMNGFTGLITGQILVTDCNGLNSTSTGCL